jgi:hypothetical protein
MWSLAWAQFSSPNPCAHLHPENLSIYVFLALWQLAKNLNNPDITSTPLIKFRRVPRYLGDGKQVRMLVGTQHLPAVTHEGGQLPASGLLLQVKAGSISGKIGNGYPHPQKLPVHLGEAY